METLLPLLALLACTIAMGLMMLFMGKGMTPHKDQEAQSPDAPSLAELKAEQARLHEQIERLEARRPRGRDRVPSGRS